jgi:cytochrome P450
MRDFARDTLGTLSRLARAGDAVQVRVLGRPIHFVFHPALVRAAMMEDEKTLLKEPRQLRVFQLGQGRNVLTTVGDGWKRQRQLLAPAFLPRQVARTLDLMRRAALDTHDALFPSGRGTVESFDPGAYASRVTMDVMLRVLFSQPLPAAETADMTASVRHLITKGQQMLLWALVPAQWMPFPGRGELMRHRSLLSQRVRAHIEARRASRGQADGEAGDLLDMMLAAEDSEAAAVGGGHLAGREIEDNCLALFLAGHETSSVALTWWCGYMALHPEHADRARQEVAEVMGADWQTRPLDPAPFGRLHFLEATLEEAMRLRPPVVGPFNRQASADIRLHGLDIRRGDLVSASIWHLHHDARWFPEPERFRPERFLPGAPDIPRGAYMPFGAGRHVCLGQHFATMEMKLIAALLLSRARWAFAPGQGLPEPRVDVTLKPAQPLRLLLTEVSGSPAAAVSGGQPAAGGTA